MAYFINLRSHPVGGWLDTSGSLKVQWSPPATVAGFNQPSVDPARFLADVRGQNILLATHGFNVDFYDGVNELTNWSTLLDLPDPALFVGVLWPGDSGWAHGLDYPEEPRVADDAGAQLALIIESMLSDAASISLASHSLGARVVLQTIDRLSIRVRRLILMAGAIDDNCLTSEFQQAALRVDAISVLASRRDEVLAWAFPLGNLVGGIIDRGHPWWHGALGRYGPATPPPANYRAPFEIPRNWAYGHHDYLQYAPPYTGAAIGEVVVPRDGSPKPILDPQGAPVPGWQEAWSAAFARTRFK